MVSGRTGPDPWEPLQPGKRIGRYRIEKELGRGGMSVVYLAEDLHLGKYWAVKAIRKPPEGMASEGESGRASLRAEAELMKKLEHPALPRIVDIFTEQDSVILVMDYVEGDTLAELLKRIGPFSEKLVREWLICLAGVLQYLHSQDPPVIYRDMKPANVIRKRDGSLVLLDLGIAREYKTDQELDTVALGTRGYAPPEQYGNAQTDIRSDIYSLGMTGAELLTGIPPDKDPWFYQSHPFRKVFPEISQDMENILNRCLAFSPRDRFESCAALIRALRHQDRLQRKGKSGRPGTVKRGRILVLTGLLVWEGLAVLLTGNAKEKTAQAQTTQVQTEPEQTEPAQVESTQAESEKVESEQTEKVQTGLGAAESEQAEQETEFVSDEVALAQDPAEELLSFLADSERSGVFSEEQGRLLQEHLAALPEEIRQDSRRYGEICFEAGRLYLFCYTGDKGSLRSRILHAQPYFAEAEVPEAGAYRQLCDYYITYVFGVPGIEGPDTGDCMEALQEIRICLEEADKISDGDGPYLQLVWLQSMAELLREYRQSFADTWVSREELTDVLDQIEEKVRAARAERADLAALQEEILAACAHSREDILRAYENIEKWKEAEHVYEKNDGAA